MSDENTLPQTAAAPGSEPGGDRDAWAWATEHGAPEMASTEQLLLWLARGELPPYTLVWKPGWGEWLPAMQVAELAGAFPRVTAGSRRVARAAPDNTVTPPIVPVEHYPRLRLLVKDVLGDSPVPPAAAVSQGLAPAQVGRRALRDVDLMQRDLVTSQVPAAAMLEAARAMKRPGAPAPSNSAERWGRLELGRFGETAPAAVSPPVPTLSPVALELGVAASPGPVPAKNMRRNSTSYGPWLLFGALAGGGLGLLSVASPETLPAAWQASAPTVVAAPSPAPSPAPLETPPVLAHALEVTPRALSVEDLPRVAPAAAPKPPGAIQVKHEGELAVLRALRTAKNETFDRVVFEFHERVPGYRLGYLHKPIRDCAQGSLRRVEGESWLEVRFSPASVHTENGEPTVRERELKPGLSMVRELERTCDFEGVVTWVVGTAAAQRYRAYELSAPPRLVVEIEH